ncbi:hypothetical protein PV350_04680 [Streptomyces sp. PA03-6a]|nr:hypothetical protein [Streptomyces sp. PA03-6a]
MILGLCDRFHKLPSEVFAEDSELLHLIEIERLGTPDMEGGDGGYGQ